MKDQKKIRLGLIGVGNWALFAHVRVLRLFLPEYEIVGYLQPIQQGSGDGGRWAEYVAFLT